MIFWQLLVKFYLLFLLQKQMVFTFVQMLGVQKCTVCYEEITFYNQKVDINSKEAEYKTYIDIESGECIRASKMRNNVEEDLISTFESKNVVLNPHNTSKNSNGYDEVRLDFFETAIKDSQAKARKN